MQEKELEAELERKKESEKPSGVLSKMYSTTLQEESLEKLKTLIKKYNNFDGWNLDTVEVN